MIKMKKFNIFLLLIFFIVVNVAVFLISQSSMNQKIELSIDRHIDKLQTHYDTLSYRQKITADAVYLSTMNRDDVLDVLEKAYKTQDKNERDKLRKELNSMLSKKYEIISSKGVLQYHFVFPDNISFFRFHKKDKYGDSLVGVRPDYEQVNKTKEKVSGFVQGRTAHAFRYVYPIFTKNKEYIGAIEISFSSENLQGSLTLISKIHTHFLVKKDIFSAKAWERDDLVLHYMQSAEHEDYMMTLSNYHSEDGCITKNKKNLQDISKEISQKMKGDAVFGIYKQYKNGEVKVHVFLPIYSKFQRQVVAWVVSIEKDEFISITIQNTLYIRLIMFFIFLVLFYFIYRALNEKEFLHQKVVEEIAKNRQKDQQLIEQARLAQMGEMISMIAHQWRQPLGAISTSMANLQLRLELESFDLETKESRDECVQYFLTRLKNNEGYVQNLTNTIDDFRNFYKPNKLAVESSLQEVMKKSLNIVRASLINDDIEIVEVYDVAEVFKVYEGEMMQVMLNLLKNAQDNFAERKIENKKIIITTDKRNISICDNGGGISADVIDKVFDPYFSTKAAKNGTGLGLYMSKTIVQEHHGGDLSILSENGSTCFTIDLSDTKEL